GTVYEKLPSGLTGTTCVWPLPVLAVSALTPKLDDTTPVIVGALFVVPPLRLFSVTFGGVVSAPELNAPSVHWPISLPSCNAASEENVKWMPPQIRLIDASTAAELKLVKSRDVFGR